MYKLVNDNSRNNIIVRGQDYHSYMTRSKEIIRTTKYVTNWSLLRSSLLLLLLLLLSLFETEF